MSGSSASEWRKERIGQLSSLLHFYLFHFLWSRSQRKRHGDANGPAAPIAKGNLGQNAPKAKSDPGERNGLIVTKRRVGARTRSMSAVSYSRRESPRSWNYLTSNTLLVRLAFICFNVSSAPKAPSTVRDLSHLTLTWINSLSDFTQFFIRLATQWTVLLKQTNQVQR